MREGAGDAQESEGLKLYCFNHTSTQSQPTIIIERTIYCHKRGLASLNMFEPGRHTLQKTPGTPEFR